MREISYATFWVIMFTTVGFVVVLLRRRDLAKFQKRLIELLSTMESTQGISEEDVVLESGTDDAWAKVNNFRDEVTGSP